MSALDRDAARVVLKQHYGVFLGLGGENDVLDALEACLRPTPAPTMNELIEVLREDGDPFEETAMYRAQRVLGVLNNKTRRVAH